MSQETLKRAVDLAKGGMIAEAIDLLRPMFRDHNLKPSALAGMAFSHEWAGNIALAKYLYAEAIRLQPENAQWANLLARCEESHQKRIAEAREKKPSRWPMVLCSFLLLLSVVIIGGPLSGFPREIFDLIDINTTQLFVPIVIVGTVLAVLAVVLLAVTIVSIWRYRKAVGHAIGEDFADNRHVSCCECGLKYLKRENECPYCGSSCTRQPRKAETTSAPRASKAASPSPSWPQTPTEAAEIPFFQKENYHQDRCRGCGKYSDCDSADHLADVDFDGIYLTVCPQCSEIKRGAELQKLARSQQPKRRKTVCPRCQMEISDRASMCPYCRKQIRLGGAARVVVTVIAIFGLLYIFGILFENPSGPPVSTSIPEPDYIKTVAAYKEGSDGIMVYFILADATGAMTTSPGKVTVAISENRHPRSNYGEGSPSDYEVTLLYSTSVSVNHSDFVRTKIGLGAFAHDAIICPIGRIKYASFSRAPQEPDGKVAVSFELANGRTLKGNDTIFF